MTDCGVPDSITGDVPTCFPVLTSKVHMKGITGALYRARCDALTVTDVSWLPYTEHRGVRAFELISSFQDDRWMHFVDNVLAVDELCLVPGQDDYDGYEAIAQRLERVLNLRMVTVGTKLYDIMQDFLTIARGGASADGSVRARQRRRTEH
ncbi:hypothetical protein GmHk_04G010183 [Glycine max]|nr:hypothetical protein GmHk_04G010183 [Glycine max]KAH1253557.1 hypothetical protein GmHk_04G010183 [Glycine max]